MYLGVFVEAVFWSRYLFGILSNNFVFSLERRSTIPYTSGHYIIQSLQCDIILNNLTLVSNYDVVLHVAVYMCHFPFHCSRIQKKLIHH